MIRVQPVSNTLQDHVVSQCSLSIWANSLARRKAAPDDVLDAYHFGRQRNPSQLMMPVAAGHQTAAIASTMLERSRSCRHCAPRWAGADFARTINVVLPVPGDVHQAQLRGATPCRRRGH